MRLSLFAVSSYFHSQVFIFMRLSSLALPWIAIFARKCDCHAMVNSLAIARIAISTRNLRLSSLRLYDQMTGLGAWQKWCEQWLMGPGPIIDAPRLSDALPTVRELWTYNRSFSFVLLLMVQVLVSCQNSYLHCDSLFTKSFTWSIDLLVRVFKQSVKATQFFKKVQEQKELLFCREYWWFS